MVLILFYVILTLWYLFSMLIYSGLIVSEKGFFSNYISDIRFIIGAVVNAFTLAVIIILYNMMKSLLRKYLNFYYHKTRVELKKLHIISVMTFIFWIGLKVFYVFRRIQPGIDNYKSWDALDIIIFIVLFIPLNLFFYYAVFLNFNIIDFKKYLQDIYYGFTIPNQYQGSSIFIRPS